MKFPYGISDFATIIEENYFYVDRTDRIPAIEESGRQLIFLRPRRFGKSLLANMLANYYDIAKADKFNALFGQLKIGQNPTPLHNQYFVMTWDFSAIPLLESTDALRKTLYGYLNAVIHNFYIKYQTYFAEPIVTDADVITSFRNLFDAISRTDRKLYLFIDEYDNFANEVMAAQLHDNKRYTELVYGEGLLKGIFKNIKVAATGNGLDRVFITGVSPVVLADMSSGYNVVVNIYRRAEFNDLCGFHETEIQKVLAQIGQKHPLTASQQADILDIMRRFYNGYCFNTRHPETIYNPTLALYFFDALNKTGLYPETLLDHNLAMDRNRLSYITKLPNGQAVIEQALDETQALEIPELYDRFGVEDMLYSRHEPYQLASLLYYLGVLTLDGMTPTKNLKLRIPNLVIRSLYVEKLRKLLLPDVQYQDSREAIENFVSRGNIQALCELIESRFSVFSNRDYKKAEMAIKTAFLIFLFDDRLYIVDSEPELKRRYADLVLICRPDSRDYEILDHVLEFKFIPLKDLNLNAEQIRNESRDVLKNLPKVQTAFAEAREQLVTYADVLKKRYGQVLRLHTTAVIAIGFERLLWQEFEF